MYDAFITRLEPETIEKIDSFLKLEKGWHYGEGDVPSKKTVESAKNLAEQAIWSSFDTNAFPGIDGEILVTVYSKDYCLEFTVESDGKIIFVYEFNDQEIEYSEGLNFREAQKKLDDFCERIYNKKEWNTSGLSTSPIMIPEESVLSAWPLKIQKVMESLSSPYAASTSPGKVFASI